MSVVGVEEACVIGNKECLSLKHRKKPACRQPRGKYAHGKNQEGRLWDCQKLVMFCEQNGSSLASV